MKREDLKIGDVIYVNHKGQISEKGIKVTINEKIETNDVFRKSYIMIGVSDNNKKWSSDYIITP